MEAELGGDRPHPPVLGEEEAADLDDLRGGDHRRPRRPGSGARAVPAPTTTPQTAGGVGLGPAEEPAPAPTAGAAGPTIGMGSEGVWRIGPSRLAAAEALHGRRGRARREGATGGQGQGSLMRHAGAAPRPVGPLPIAVIETALRTLLVATPGGAEAPRPPGVSARKTAVGMAPITGPTEDEGLPAPLAGPQAEDLHGPVGPEMAGRRWTSPRECATTRVSRPRLPWGGCARGPRGSSSGPSPSPLRGRDTLLETRPVYHSVFGWRFRFIQVQVSANIPEMEIETTGQATLGPPALAKSKERT